MNTVLVDLQYGDSGKGKIADWLMEDHDICVRYSGGPNTGTTVWINDKKYALHHLPVGLLRNKPSYIASTCIINPKKLLKEIKDLKSQGFDVDSNLKISPYCHVISDSHIVIDIQKEDSGTGVGSTKQGMMPCIRDKYSRQGQRLYENLEYPELQKYFANVSYELAQARDSHKKILFQSAQGTMLDIDHGGYPFISTTNNVAGFAAGASGFGPQYVNDVVGVFKPYVTYVGNGPFDLEIKNQALNDTIAELGQEYGTTTGRRRRIGWLSIPLLEYACRINGVTKLALTKGDVLEGLEVHIDNRTNFKQSDPLFLQNYKPSFTKFSDKFTVKEFVTFFNHELTSLTIPDLYYISEGKEREKMRLI
jgi:adenylosuccinate synthase